ncbi:MAG: hypothetical protein QM820_17635 [Minicystis sp.]
MGTGGASTSVGSGGSMGAGGAPGTGGSMGAGTGGAPAGSGSTGTGVGGAPGTGGSTSVGAGGAPSSGSTTGAGGAPVSSGSTTAGAGGSTSGSLSTSASSSSTSASSTSGASSSSTSASSSSSSSSTSASSSSSSSTTSASSSTSSSGSTSGSSSSSSSGTAIPATCSGACGQPGCTAFTCADKGPAGWSDPFQLYNGPADQTPSCPSWANNNVLSAFQDPKQDPAQCSQCTIVGQPYGQWCYAGISTYSDGTCSAEDPTNIFLGLGFCNNLGSNDYVSAVGTQAPQAVYYCDASAQTPTIPPVAWNKAAVGCTVPSPAVNGCGAAQLCIPRPQVPFGAQLCISKTGDTACPAATAYTVKNVVYSSALDNRSCTPCGYTRTDITCTGTAVLYSDTACQNDVAAVTDYSGACKSIPGSVGSVEFVGATFSGTPSCTAAGGDPTGSVAPVGPVTVCCTP